ncbi:MAG: AraC family transcriptional regulator [Roseovarius sp.]|uniref:AraC family transcriptional regulator n=1 Tax=Roseovarius sp. TaxID=1486281 RepID=UPI0032F067D2
MESLLDHGVMKFPKAGLLATSESRSWNGIAAELRAHPAGEIPDICAQQTEITFAVHGSAGGSVQRRGNGQLQITPSRTGTIWLCPSGIQEDHIRITENIPEVLHVYLPPSQLDIRSESTSHRPEFGEAFYRAGLEDEFVRQICLRIVAELREETSGGALLMEHLAMALTAHLFDLSDRASRSAPRSPETGALDRRRLRRVCDYIETHWDSELSIADLASVACLSRYHFSRAFTAATGETPGRYIGRRRLEHAAELLRRTDISLTDIAALCCFSSQTAFAKAFRRRFQQTPGAFRRRVRA